MRKRRNAGLILPVCAVILLILLAVFYNDNIFLGKTSSYGYPTYDSKPILTYNTEDMLYLEIDNISNNPTIKSVNSNLSIKLSNPNSDKNTKCSYKMFFVWDTLSDAYIKTDNIEKELVVTGSIDNQKIFEKIQLGNSSEGRTFLTKGNIEIQKSQMLTQNIDISLSFYDYKNGQENHYNKTYVGKIAIDDIICLEEN